MKLYIGIKRSNGYYYIAALNNQGVAVLKSKLPTSAPTEAITQSLTSLKDAFQAPLRIAICREYSTDLSFVDAIEKDHGHVKLVDYSLLYSTDLIPQKPLDHDHYRDPIQLAILRSLDE